MHIADWNYFRTMRLRIGQGYDIHRMKEGRPCVLGGVQIEHPSGPDGHSDADVLIHAIADALLGAAGLKDIGFYFPDSDLKFKNIDSKKILAEVVHMLEENKFQIANIDSTVIAEEPKINPHIPAMKKILSTILHIDETCIGIKATTNEKLGEIGKGEGIAATAVALLQS